MNSLPDLTVNLPSGKLGQSTSNVPAIVGATLGTLAGLILIAAIVFFLRRRRRRRESIHIDGPLEELQLMQREPSTVTPFTDEVQPLVTNGVQDQNKRRYFVQNVNPPSKNSKTEKFATIRSSDSTHQTATATDGSVAGGRSSPAMTSRDGQTTPAPVDDGNLRQEVEQLRRVVETLSSQQVQQPPRVVYSPGSLLDDPPPMYPS